MIKIENIETMGWEAAIRGMRNPMNSWDKSDSEFNAGCDFNCETCNLFEKKCSKLGDNDLELMRKLASNGPVHAKYRRMITVYMDITAPLYWWKEFDTYKVGTVANSCSTMHKIAAKEFTIDDFSHEHLFTDAGPDFIYSRTCEEILVNTDVLAIVVEALNGARKRYLETKDKSYWWQMIQLLPSSYNQKRTVMLNYEVLHNMYHSRKDHKLDEWRTFCSIVTSLPYSSLITIKEN